MVTATCPVYIYAAVKLLKKCRKGNANCALKDKCQHFVTKWNAKIIQPLCNDTVEDYTEASSKQTDRFHIKLRWAQEINYHHHLYKNTIIIIMWYMYKCRCKNCSILAFVAWQWKRLTRSHLNSNNSSALHGNDINKTLMIPSIGMIM